MKQKSIYFVFICLLTAIAASYGCINNTQKDTSLAITCPEGINLLPMYGKAQKCPQQINADNELIEYCINEYGSRQNASLAHVEMGWGYFHDNDLDLAMKRFNQAWLLDSLNAAVYLGFGCIEDRKGNINEAITLAEKSIELNPNMGLAWQNSGMFYYHRFQTSHNVNDLSTSINNLKKSAQIIPQNDKAYYLLALAYSHYNQKDSMMRYIEITDKLNPKLIEPQTRKELLK